MIHGRYQANESPQECVGLQGKQIMSTQYHRYRSHFHSRRLQLDPVRKKLGGVCAGIADYLDVAPLFVRICALLSLCIFTQITLIAYGIAYFVLDQKIAE